VISDNTSLASLDGLENLGTIGQSLSIRGNSLLEDLQGLNGLNHIGTGIYIEGNDLLANLHGLENLEVVGDDLVIGGNDNLSSLTGLDNLASIGGDLKLGYYGNFGVHGNPKLSSLEALGELATVGGSVTIQYNSMLPGLTGLENLNLIGGDLNISFNNSIHSLSGIDNLEAASVKNLYVYDNHVLETCDVQSICEYLVSPNGVMDIYDNDDGCNDPEEVATTCGVGLTDVISGKNQFHISPNPASTQITIEISIVPSQFQLSIFNLNGQEVLDQPVNDPVIVIDIAQLPAGVYFVRLLGEKMVGVEKFVKID